KRGKPWASQSKIHSPCREVRPLLRNRHLDCYLVVGRFGLRSRLAFRSATMSLCCLGGVLNNRLRVASRMRSVSSGDRSLSSCFFGVFAMDKPTDSVWPSYLKGQRDHIHAIGVVALNFNRLEILLHSLLFHYLGTKSEVAHAHICRSLNLHSL